MGPIYAREEIVDFLEFIGMPEAYRDPDQLSPSHDLLKRLHIHMISTVPYETLLFHYGNEGRVILDPKHLFQNIVKGGRGRGGYCLYNNLFFLYMLRSIGFSAYPVGVKTRLRVGGPPEGEFSGWGHTLTIVRLPDETQWVTDVCFGGDGPTQPMRLEDGFTMLNIGTQEVRLVRDFLPGQVSHDDKHKMWQYQYRNHSDHPWLEFHAFSDCIEWMPPDFDVLNYFEGENPDSISWNNVVVVKFLRRAVSEERANGKVQSLSEQEIYGKRILIQNTFKENLGGQTDIVQVCRTEDDRVQGLEKWFGIELTEDERCAIRGRPSELKPE